MQQAVRESVAAVFESMMSSDDSAHVVSNIQVMRTVLHAGGSTVKDVADWLRMVPVVQPLPIEAAFGPAPAVPASTIKAGAVWSSKTGGSWTPAPKAALPKSSFDEEEACELGLDYVRDFVGKWVSCLSPKELDFMLSLTQRFGERRLWMTVKQQAWLDTIARRVGHPTIT